MARLAWLDRATGRCTRRYEHEAPGGPIHVDIKQLGLIPDDGGLGVTGRSVGFQRRNGPAANRWPGYDYLYKVVEDH